MRKVILIICMMAFIIVTEAEANTDKVYTFHLSAGPTVSIEDGYADFAGSSARLTIYYEDNQMPYLIIFTDLPEDRKYKDKPLTEVEACKKIKSGAVDMNFKQLKAGVHCKFVYVPLSSDSNPLAEWGWRKLHMYRLEDKASIEHVISSLKGGRLRVRSDVLFDVPDYQTAENSLFEE